MKKILITTAIAGALLFNGVSAEAHCPYKHKPCMDVKNEQIKNRIDSINIELSAINSRLDIINSYETEKKYHEVRLRSIELYKDLPTERIDKINRKIPSHEGIIENGDEKMIDRIYLGADIHISSDLRDGETAVRIIKNFSCVFNNSIFCFK